MVVVIQGLIILVCGALEQALRGPVEALLRRDGSGGGAARNRWGGLGEERRSLPPSTT
jgi:glycine/D-amino acid oxidase-like deaminating enzyme